MSERAAERTVTREMVLGVLKAGGLVDWTTRDIARELGAGEHRVRAVVAWLVIGGQVEIDGRVTRRDAMGRPYTAQRYRWTGRMQVRRVTRDRERRRENWTRPPSEAATWLARAWV
jgi:predicted ArsR family transcriptional regulator